MAVTPALGIGPRSAQILKRLLYLSQTGDPWVKVGPNSFLLKNIGLRLPVPSIDIRYRGVRNPRVAITQEKAKKLRGNWCGKSFRIST